MPPLALRLILLALAGALVGTYLNRGIYRWAFFNPRDIGPWSRPPDGAPSRRWLDFVPILGWFSLRRESKWHGPGFWIRPLLIEASTAAAFAALYWWNLNGGPAGNLRPPYDLEMLHAQYLLQVMLLSLMIVATFIDLDEKTIPDEVTVPGTLAALVLAAAWPISRLPNGFPPRAAEASLWLTSPHEWPAAILDGNAGLAYGLLCIVAWCFTIMPFKWNPRLRFSLAMRVFLLSVFSRRASRRYHLLAILGCAAIAAIWWQGGDRWHSLLSALVGMAFGGALVWAVRVVGSKALGVEAMGFGDVILLAMIGAFLGWQPALLVFFMSPFAALFIGVTQWIITRKTEIAFGPYLCLAALFLITGWSEIWERSWKIFELGLLVPVGLAVSLLLMGLMLGVWAAIKRQIAAAAEPKSRRKKKRKSRQM